MSVTPWYSNKMHRLEPCWALAKTVFASIYSSKNKPTHVLTQRTNYFSLKMPKNWESLFTDRPLALNWVLCCVYLRSWETLAAAAGSTRRDTRWAFCTVSNAGVATLVFYSVHTVLKFSVANLPTVWKFQDFSIFQILREINFGECKRCKTAVFCHFRGTEYLWFGRFQPSKVIKIKMC